jgi:hypothetical protein
VHSSACGAHVLSSFLLLAQAKGEVDEHSEVLADFKAQALPLARIKKVRLLGKSSSLLAARAVASTASFSINTH